MKIDVNGANPEMLSQLINSGLFEFSEQGYKRSSLNKILTNAKVSKGFFYHYFKSKSVFHKYLIEYSVDILLERYNKEELLEEQDFIVRMQKQAIYKIEISKQYPYLFPFLAHIYRDFSFKEYTEMVEKMTNNFLYRFLNENIDYSMIRDDLDKESAMKMITRYVQSIQNEFMSNLNTDKFDDMFQYFNKELEVLKKVVYKTS